MSNKEISDVSPLNYKLKKVIRDGTPVVKFKCPRCGMWGDIDDDQFHGRVSILCQCTFHETINLAETLEGIIFQVTKETPYGRP